MEYFLILRDAIDNIPITFNWNMDGIGDSDWAIAHPETVYVPRGIAGDQVPITVNHAIRLTK
jgi:hypothetical protein